MTAAAKGAGHVRAMAKAVVAVSPVADEVSAEYGSAAEVDVREADAAVDYIGTNARAGRTVGIGIVDGPATLIDTVDAP